MTPLELLAHPVRLRIVNAMRGRRELTTAELSERITDVSKATLYRHVDLLIEGDVLEVAEERRVRGAVERRFRLQQERASITPDVLDGLTMHDHERAFNAAVAALLAEFTAYSRREDADPIGDMVGYRQHGIWVTPDELQRLIAGLRTAILPVLSNDATPERNRYVLSPIFFPAEGR